MEHRHLRTAAKCTSCGTVRLVEPDENGTWNPKECPECGKEGIKLGTAATQ